MGHRKRERKRNRFFIPCIPCLAYLMSQRYLRYQAARSDRLLSLSLFIPPRADVKNLATIVIRQSCESHFDGVFFFFSFFFLSLLSSRHKIAMYNSGSDAARHVRKLEHGELISSFELSTGSGGRRHRFRQARTAAAPLLLNLFQFAGVTYCISTSAS
jgi:hypothetical protein